MRKVSIQKAGGERGEGVRDFIYQVKLGETKSHFATFPFPCKHLYAKEISRGRWRERENVRKERERKIEKLFIK